MAAPTQLSCGVLVTDGACVLLGHATGSPRWDIPKGLCEPGELVIQAARRELLEEAGLDAPLRALQPLGRFAYRPGKDLVLFAWHMRAMVELAGLRCRSTFLRNGRAVPEFDRFASPTWAEALPMLGKSMAAVLAPLIAVSPWPETPSARSVKQG